MAKAKTPETPNEAPIEGKRGFFGKIFDLMTLGPIRRNPKKSALIIATLLGVGSNYGWFREGTVLQGLGKGFDKLGRGIGGLAKGGYEKIMPDAAQKNIAETFDSTKKTVGTYGETGLAWLKDAGRYIGLNIPEAGAAPIK